MLKKCIREKPEDDEDSGAKRLFPDRQTNYTRKRLLLQYPIGGRFAHKYQEKCNIQEGNSESTVGFRLKSEIDGAKIDGLILKESVY